jgi:copper chaperone CopZ
MRHRPSHQILGLAILIALCAVFGAGCRKQDVRTVVIRCPEMKTQACAERIVEALSEASYGVSVDSVRPDLEARVVTLEYDSMLLSIKNIEAIVAKAGFTANEMPANPAAAAALPEECR